MWGHGRRIFDIFVWVYWWARIPAYRRRELDGKRGRGRSDEEIDLVCACVEVADKYLR